MRRTPWVPLPWREVALAVAAALSGSLRQVSEVAGTSMWLGDMVRVSGMVLIGVLAGAGVLAGSRRGSLLNVPAWGLVALGLWVHQVALRDVENPLSGPLTWALLIAMGLPFAREHGLRACLFLVVVVMADVGATVGLVMEDRGLLGLGFGWGDEALFCILVPIVVLRARSVVAQVAGLLLPIICYLACFSYVVIMVDGMRCCLPLWSLLCAREVLAGVGLSMLVYGVLGHILRALPAGTPAEGPLR